MKEAASHANLWNAVDAAAATGGRSRRYWEASGVAIDSRNLNPGDLFIALHDQRDGHEFVSAALKAGAHAAMVTHVPSDVAADAPLLVVDDTMSALQRLGMFGRSRSNAKRIAVTGSVGKTGTKEALGACFSAIGETHTSVASYNNHWGVPLTLARMPSSTRFGVFEIGMNHAGEIAQLSPQVAPEIAIITTIAPAHLAFFNSTEDIARAKAEIFVGIPDGGVAIIHGDAPHAALLIEIAQKQALDVYTFGRTPGCRLQLMGNQVFDDYQEIDVAFDGRRINYALGAFGEHWADNSMAVLASIIALDVPTDQALAPLKTFQPGAGRGERCSITIAMGQIDLIDESYNANPTSVAAAIRVLGDRPGRKVAILGDMLELGINAPAMHAELADVIDEKSIDLVLTCGPLMAMLAAAVPSKRRGPHSKNAAGLIQHLGDFLEGGDTVLVKGSLGIGMKVIVDAIHQMAVPEHGCSSQDRSARAGSVA